MSLGQRIALTAGLAVALVVIVVMSVVRVITERELRAEVDAFLVTRAEAITDVTNLLDAAGRDRRPFRFAPGLLEGSVFGPDSIVQLVQGNGTYLAVVDEEVRLPVEEIDFAIAEGGRARTLRTVDVGDTTYRMITEPGRPGLAVQVARDLTETEAVIAGLQGRALLIGAVGILAAAALGWVVARSALVPVDRLTAAARHVADTQDLDAEIAVERSDELGSLAESFNEMLAALNESRLQQRRLALDASHELRTPLTSLRTNLELLQRAPDLDPAERDEIMADVRDELGELQTLVEELVATATDTREAEDAAPVRLDELAERLAERARRRSGHEVTVVAAPTSVVAPPSLLERAAWNVVHNAIKWNPSGRPIEITAAAGRFAVRDHGPGIDPEDLPHVFERFYRAVGSRATPGSGLGLAIVARVVADGGGTVFAENHPGGGALVGFALPTEDRTRKGFSSVS